jgi:hypothetical protein
MSSLLTSITSVSGSLRSRSGHRRGWHIHAPTLWNSTRFCPLDDACNGTILQWPNLSSECP